MTQEELTKVFKYIVKKCDMLINNGNYEADAYTQDTVEDIAELCNHILDEDYGKLVEVKDADLEKDFFDWYHEEKNRDYNASILYERYSIISKKLAKYFYELGLKVAQKGE